MRALLAILALAIAGCATAPAPAESNDPDRWVPRKKPAYPEPFE